MHSHNATTPAETPCAFATSNAARSYHVQMEGIIGGRTASDMPGLDIAEQRSWQNFLDSALRMYATLNRSLVDEHQLTLNDVRLLDLLDKSPHGAARMGDLAEALMSLPSRVTRQIHRLEMQGLVRRGASPDDGRGVLASITDEGRDALGAAMQTYGDAVRAHFLDRLSRPQIVGDGGELPADQRRAESRGAAGEDRSRLDCPAVAWQSGLMHSP